MKRSKLPKKASQLINVALNDLEKVQKLKDYKIDMDVWHEANEKQCSVCFAGAVISQTIKASRWDSSYPQGLMEENVINIKDRDALQALDYLRGGNTDEALQALNVDVNEEDQGDFNRYIPPFKGTGVSFKKAMKKLANDLEKAGY